MEIRSLRIFVFLCITYSLHVTSVSSQNTSTSDASTSPPDQTTALPDTDAPTDSQQTDSTPTDTQTPDTASPDATSTGSSTDTEQQTTVDTSTETTSTQTASDATETPTGTEETTQGQSTPQSTGGQTEAPGNSTEGPTGGPTVTTGNDTESTEQTTSTQTNDTDTTESPDGSTPVPDNSTPTQAPGGSTTPADGGDNSTETSSSTAATPSTSTSAPTQGPTTLAPPATEYPPVEADTDIASFTLQLKFNTPEVSCNGSYLRDELDKSLQSTSGYRGVKTVEETQFNASYSAKSLVESDSASVRKELTNALDVPSDCYTFNQTGLDDVISEFAAQTRVYCSARYLCPLGYTCREGAGGPLCVSVCEGAACQNGGQCDVVINKQEATAEPRCRCVDTIGTVYSGDKCEESRINPERVAAIVGGVLGGVCLILLIALYCTCYRKRENSGKKYHLSGVYNETYDHASLDMKNM